MCGSIMNGLALDTSDMDLVIYGLRVSNRANLQYHMKQITCAIDRMDFIKECRFIHTAHVPVIKVIVDLRKVKQDSEDGSELK